MYNGKALAVGVVTDYDEYKSHTHMYYKHVTQNYLTTTWHAKSIQGTRYI